MYANVLRVIAPFPHRSLLPNCTMQTHANTCKQLNTHARNCKHNANIMQTHAI